jgi:hypothetical protein
MSRFPLSITPRVLRVGLPCLLLCVGLTGCGVSTVEVTGTVRYNGKPLSSGTIQFLGADGVPSAATIQKDGTYCARITPGTVKVIVSSVDEVRLTEYTARSASARGRATPAPPAPAQQFSKIPQRYSDWTTSGLTLAVEGDRTVQDLDLTGK